MQEEKDGQGWEEERKKKNEGKGEEMCEIVC